MKYKVLYDCPSGIGEINVVSDREVTLEECQSFISGCYNNIFETDVKILKCEEINENNS